MNKYINEIEQSNSFIKAFINEFNKLLLEEKSKKTKGRIKIKTIKEHYKNSLFNTEDFQTYTVSQDYPTANFELRNINQFNDIENEFFIESAHFEINKKNNEVKLEFINFKKILNKEISVNYYLSSDLKSKGLNVLLTLICNKTATEKNFYIEESILKIYEKPHQQLPSKEFDKNKKTLDNFMDFAKINREMFFDYLFLGKDIDKEVADLLLLGNDIDIKNNNIFRMNLLNEEVNENNKKMSLS